MVNHQKIGKKPTQRLLNSINLIPKRQIHNINDSLDLLKAQNLKNVQLNGEYTIFKLQLITNFLMKTKNVSTKLSFLPKIGTDSNIDDTHHTSFDNQKLTIQNCKNDTTVSSSSQNQIQTRYFLKKKKNQPKDEDFDTQFHQYSKKSSNYKKKKNISKRNYLPKKTTKNYIKPKAMPLNLHKTQKNHLKSKTIVKEQNVLKKILIIEKNKNKSFQPKEKEIKPLKKEINRQKINFCELAQIKMLAFDRKLLQKKRQDLLKRSVQDWNLVDKGRSQKRQLRNLNV